MNMNINIIGSRIVGSSGLLVSGGESRNAVARKFLRSLLIYRLRSHVDSRNSGAGLP